MGRSSDSPANLRPRTGRVPLFALILASLLVVGACSGPGGSDDSASGDSGSNGAAASADPGEAELDDAAGGEAGNGEPRAELVDSASVRQATEAAGRELVFTAAMELEVEVLEESLQAASDAVEAVGGFTANEQVDLGAGRRATVTYRVPADGFDEALDSLEGVGRLRTQSADVDDVTAQYADLEGRVTTLRTSISRLQGFLAQAGDADQIASLEGELTRREAELESTESQRRALSDSIALSTITVEFAASDAAPLDDTRSLPTFLGGLERGWDFFVGIGAFALAVLGFLAPFLPVLIIAAIVLQRVTRKRQTPATP